ncbi:E3 SUMO-protein ligase ZNF451 isoform X1 [Carcharodon carcharias]|uniref:E3 SUMO-protein ligase ZNF451 isoform X1 n=1 Tax=Carcharodon carcharias TaxID=13397 RepID=UPI001B7E3EAC|nr:E3 SUMO-protein ligase ZNF451 isoform X1 [Carcharodon carcharias]
MSSSDGLMPAEKRESEEEVIFVSEQPLRPVLECIDLLSDEDSEGNTAQHHRKPKDHIDWQKERVLSTLDRLARHVEVEKQLKEEKCKAFQEKVDSQHAHGMQELEFIQGQPATEEARRCVDGWLKVPGPKPGVVSFGRGGYRRHTNASVTPDPIDCPIMNCNRKFDNRHLLLGHLKRFDHSPCDPTITLHGSPSTWYICVACCQRFINLQKYEEHLASKVNTLDHEGHQRDLEPQITQCFACPSCYLLFNLRDECLQHMAKTNHFLQRHKLSGEQGTRCPLPFPNYAKKLLISLCQEIPFQVKCTACQQMLRTHIELTAHFRTRCRRAGPVAVSAKDISQVAAIFKVRGSCLDCSKLFVDDNQINQHTQQTMHNIRWIRTMEKAILEFCHFNEKSKTPSDLRMILDQSKAKKNSPFKRPLAETCSNEAAVPTSSKRTRRECNNVQVKEEKVECDIHLGARLWFCECHQRFDNEEAVEKHVMAVNGIRHKCLVCGKLALDAGIIGLHMSRSHGGAHLTNYRLWCERCHAELRRKEDLMAHIVECHSGHAYYYEKQVDKDELLAFEPSSSKSAWSLADLGGKEGEGKQLDPNSPEVEAAVSDGSWQCRLCEEMFDSEESVAQHCSCLANHQFHKYSCGLCRKHFHRVETLYRHSRDQHDNELSVKYFCGLCDDIEFNSEDEFLEHYKTFHSTDYVFVEHGDAVTEKEVDEEAPEEHLLMSCGCRQHYKSKKLRKEDNCRCLRNLFEQGKLWFRCSCSATAQSEEDIQNHMVECHGARETGSRSFTIKCICSKAFNDGEGAQMHYHSKHCTSQEVWPAPSLPAENEATAPHVAAFCSNTKQVPQDDDTEASTSHEIFPTTAVEKEAINQEEDIELPDLDLLRTMTHLVFIDLDNWAGFFNHLPGHLNQGTFFWGFQGGKNHWKPPENCPVYNFLVNTGCFFLHPRCSTRKDAADFAICMHAGRMDEQLPKHIPFTVLSGDKGFEELKNQLKKTMRPGHILNPHQMEGELMCALLNSISDIGKDSDDEDEVLQKTLVLSLQEATEKQKTVDEDAKIEEAILQSLEEQ